MTLISLLSEQSVLHRPTTVQLVWLLVWIRAFGHLLLDVISLAVFSP